MFRARRYILTAFFLGLLLSGAVAFGAPAFAQEAVDMEQFASQAGLATTDIRVLIANFIRIALGFVGILLVILILYGGFVWMTAGGNEDRVKRAKAILRNSVIGLVIVLSSYAIASFVLNALVTATSGDISGSDDGDDTYCDGGCGPNGGSNTFTLVSDNSACGTAAMNYQPRLTFSSRVESEVDEGDIVISADGGGDVAGEFDVRGTLVIFTPDALCADNNSYHCFAPDTDYTITLTSGLTSSSGVALQNPQEIAFHTGSALDTVGPTVDVSAPEDGASVTVGDIVALQAHATDDIGVVTVEFEADGEDVYAAGLTDSNEGTLAADNYFNSGALVWDTAGLLTNESYSIRAIGADCAGNEDTSMTVDVVVRAANCSNGIQDADLGETDVDCGGTDTDSEFYCGACDGDSCTDDSQCANGSCNELTGECETNPQIESVSPGDGAGGNYVTISGSGFGTTEGNVKFNYELDPIQAEVLSCNSVVRWSDDEIVLAVPGDATDGPISITTSALEVETTDDDNGPVISDFDINDIDRPGLCSVLDPDTGLDSAVGNTNVELTGTNFGDAQGTSTVYFTNYEASSYVSWANELIGAVVPLLNASTYRTQVFAGDYVCATPGGEATADTCSTDSDCDTAESAADDGYWCATSSCSEDRSVLCSSDEDCGEGQGACESLRQGSNQVSFTVTSVSSDEAPVISYIDTGWTTCDDGTHCAEDGDCSDGSSCTDASNWGPPGQYVTIYGTGFGTAAGTVRFVNATGGAQTDVAAIGDTDFPDACSEDYWHSTSITVKVPESYSNDETMEPGAHTLYVVRGEDGVSSDSVDFEVVNDEPGPSICSVDPSAGPPGTIVDIVGENFGSEQEGDADVVYYDNQSAASIAVWDNQSIEDAAVPDDAATGPLEVLNSEGFSSNSVSFTVGDCNEDASICEEGTQCCSDGSCSVSCEGVSVEPAHYAWRFSTGIIPETPRVLVYCGDYDDDGSKDGASPSPWEGFSQPEDVCVNAAVTATFSTIMDQATLSGANIDVEECIGTDPEDPCAAVQDVEDGLIETSETAFVWVPAASYNAGVLLTDTTYRVTLNGGEDAGAIQSAGGEYMEEDYTWDFTTAATDEQCEIGEVYVSPSRYTAVALGEDVAYLAQAMAANDSCVALNCTTYTWSWTSDEDGAVLAALEVTGSCANSVSADEETNAGDPAIITAEASDAVNTPSDTAELTIDFTDPEIVGYEPNCGEACVNANILVTFNTAMDEATLTAGNLHVFKCENATCEDNLTIVPIAGGLDYNPDTLTLTIDPVGVLTAATSYRIVFEGDSVTSTSGVPLSRAVSMCTENGALCSFQTRNSDEPCAIERVELFPADAVMSYVGERQEYDARAYGAVDDCSASGQVLDPDEYAWSGWDAEDEFDYEPGADVAFMLPSPSDEGNLELTDAVPASCTMNCLNAGASLTVNDGVCGNNAIETGEDCDDGNTANSDGCSSECVREGADGSYGTCGNGVVEQHSSTSAGEDCDGGDACSDACINLGTSELSGTLAECGDSVVDYSAATGGEDCDDGNDDSFDGCSSNCLNEGTTPEDEVYATCGDGSIDEGEDCDDGNVVEGDGCSSVCLREGANGSYGVCGDEVTDQGSDGEGEDCDGQEGCGEDCLWEGSSVNYSDASICGDGNVGTGEECDATDLSAALVGAYGVAEIDEGASQELDASGYAISNVSVTADGVTGATTLSIECSCESDNACGDASLGCGTGSCCYERPDDLSVNPASGSTDACRNTAVWLEFDQVMDVDSFDASVDANGDGEITATEYDPELYLLLTLYDANGDGTPETAVSDDCPTEAETAGHWESFVHTDEGVQPMEEGNLFVNGWRWVAGGIARLFGQPAIAAAYHNLCVVPASFTMVPSEDGGSRVYVNYENLLLANAEYKMYMNGDYVTSDNVDVGVLSTNEVGIVIVTRQQTRFTTGDEICTLDELVTEDLGRVESLENDLEDASVGLFTQTDEEHVLRATPYTIRSSGLREEITETSGYAWTIGWDSTNADGEAEDVVALAEWPTDTSDTFRSGTASGENGDETAIASATITVDNYLEPSTEGDIISGEADLQALLCENPWPEVADYPYVEDTVNYSFSYCRDAGEPGTSDDLPALNPVVVPNPLTGIFAEYLYEVEGTSDAIGVRVIGNEGYLPPDMWYDEQGFSGDAQADELDGYEAVSDGNTIYVFSSNQSDVSGTPTVYPNITVVSYNEDAGEEAQDIFDQILSTWSFNANTDDVTDVNLCTVDGGYPSNANGELISCETDRGCYETCEGEDAGTGVCSLTGASCFADSDCALAASESPVCDADKAKLRRDTRRLSDIVRLQNMVDAYGDDNTYCSITTNQACNFDADCPGGETCEQTVPSMTTGTYVRSTAVSAWPSWTSDFSNALGEAAPTDPLNLFVDCPEGYDATTCFNGNLGTFSCEDGSHVYAYKSIGTWQYALFAQLEYLDAAWAYDIDTDLTDAVTIEVDYYGFDGSVPDGFNVESSYCQDGAIYGESATCGDGVIGSGEDCEYGDYFTQSCVTDEGDDGVQRYGCTSDCTDDPSQADSEGLMGECVAFECGNGVLEDGESCDDGELNGTYGHCSSDCGASTFYCGDGYLAGGEVCDCGSVADFDDVNADPDSWSAINGCTVPNGVYDPIAATSCAYNCTAPGPTCGDAEVNGDEQCDGEYEEWDGALCSDNTACTTDDDCSSGACGDGGDACGFSPVCIGGTRDGRSCENASQVSLCEGAGGTCSADSYELFRYRGCGDPATASACEWDGWSHCVGGDQQCGNGLLEGDEICDDGNDSNNDECLNTCELNICGDDYVYTGVESCDDGSAKCADGTACVEDGDCSSGACGDGGGGNGASCTAEYGGTCNFCTATCQYQTSSGSYCGDAVRDSGEACDGDDVAYYWFDDDDDDGDGVADRVRLGECDNPPETMTEDGETYTCRLLGVCNGGDNNGDVCTLNADTLEPMPNGTDRVGCGTGECVVPTCAADCSGTCPFDYTETGLLVQSNLAGATADESIDLYSYLSGSDPDRGVLYIPECSIGTQITADVSTNDVIPPSVDIVFVTDLSGSMQWSVDGTDTSPPAGERRLDYTVESTVDAIEELMNTYDGSEGVMRIGLVSFGTSLPDGAEVDMDFSEDQNALIAEVEVYLTENQGGTPTAAGVDRAVEMFEDIPEEDRADVQIIILLSDGQPYNDINNDSCDTETECVPELATYVEGLEDIKVFSAAIADDVVNADLVGFMAHFSSDTCGNDYDNRADCDPNEDDQVEYAYQAEDADGIAEMYEAIVNAILGINVAFTSDVDGAATVTTGSVREGLGVALPFPEGFECTGSSFTIPINVSFNGTGTANMSGFEFTYCPSR